MALSDERTPIDDYEYTTGQIESLGKKWQAESPRDRKFYTSDRINRASLPDDDIEELADGGREDFPKKVMMVVNKGGNHWVSIGLTVSKDAEGRVSFDMKYSDSLTEGGDLPGFVNDLQTRIERVMSPRGGADIAKSAYVHRWRQADVVSCGPYSLENAARALDGKAVEPNPGRTSIRKKQLDMFDPSNGTDFVLIKGCSRNNKIEAVINEWIVKRQEEGVDPKSLEPKVEDICAEYISAHPEQDLVSLKEVFKSEYGTSSNYMKAIAMRPRTGNPLVDGLTEYWQNLSRVDPEASEMTIGETITSFLRNNRDVAMRLRSGGEEPEEIIKMAIRDTLGEDMLKIINNRPLKRRIDQKSEEISRSLESVKVIESLRDINADFGGSDSLGDKKYVIIENLSSGKYEGLSQEQKETLVDIILETPDAANREDVISSLAGILGVDYIDDGRSTPVIKDGLESPVSHGRSSPAVSVGNGVELDFATGGASEFATSFREALESKEKQIRKDLGDLGDDFVFANAKDAVLEELRSRKETPQEVLDILNSMDRSNIDDVISIASEMYARQTSPGAKLVENLTKKIREQEASLTRDLGTELDAESIFSMAKTGALEELSNEIRIEGGVTKEIRDLVEKMSKSDMAQTMDKVADSQNRFITLAKDMAEAVVRRDDGVAAESLPMTKSKKTSEKGASRG